MHFRALGTLTVLSDGLAVDIRPGRQPLLLACLLAHANQVVSYETLADALWPGSTADVRDALRPVVSRLRRCLDSEPGGRARLRTRPTGYELGVAAHEFDVLTFERDLQRGREAAEYGRYAESQLALSAALSTWRGPAYVDFGDIALLRPETVRLNELRKAAVEDQVDVQLALGRESDAVVTVGSLVEDEPFRERRWAQLMLALYRCGRQAEALQAYRRVRELFANELGLDPGHELVALEKRILRHDPQLDRVDDPTVDQERARHLLALGDGQRQSGGPYRRTLLEASRIGQRIGDAALMINAALAGGRGTFSRLGEVDRDRVSLLEAALVVAESDQVRARLLGALAAELAYDVDRRRADATTDEAMTSARRCGDPSTLVEVALCCAWATLGDPARQPQRHTAVQEVVALVETSSDPGQHFELAITQTTCAVECFDGAGVEATLTRMNAMADQLGEPMASWYAAVASSWGALLCGDPGHARRLSERAFELGTEIAQPDAWMIYQIQLFHIAWHQGLSTDMLAAAMRSANDGPVADPRVALASARVGHIAAAGEMLQSGYAANFASSAPTERLTDLCAWSATAAELGDRPAAERLFLLLHPWSDRIAATGAAVYPCVSHSLGRLAMVAERHEEAQGQLEAALTRHRQLRAPFFIRETQRALSMVERAFS